MRSDDETFITCTTQRKFIRRRICLKPKVAVSADLAIVGAAFVIVLGRADAAVHVRDDHLRWAAVVHPVDACAGQVAWRSKVGIAS